MKDTTALAMITVVVLAAALPVVAQPAFSEADYTITFVSTQASGLPVVKIDTKDGAPVLDKINYVNMTFSLTDPDNPGNNITVVNNIDGIRGRGNSTWDDEGWVTDGTGAGYAKKPYRIKFDEKQSLFGLPAAKSWVLLAEYYDPTLIKNTVAFELGNRFGLRFNHTSHHVVLYLNGVYYGHYMLTEHNQVGRGRVDIDEDDGWLAELDFYYSEEPKFRTTNYNLPVTIKSPEIEPADIDNSVYDFVRKDINELCDSMASARFPENGYRDLIDMQQFISYIMVPQIIGHGDFDALGSVYLYKDKNEKISMGPLWDYDMTFGYDRRTPAYTLVDTWTNRRPYPISNFFQRFFQDPVFLSKWKEFWNSKLPEISSIPSFIDETANKIGKSAEENFKIWWTNYPVDFNEQIGIMKGYYNTRIAYLNEEYNKVDAVPSNKTFTPEVFGYAEAVSSAVTLVSYGDMTDLSATLQKAESSDFEISSEWNKTPTGNGGYLATISVRPKNSLPAATYTDALVLSGRNQGKTFSLRVPLSFAVNAEVSVLPPNRAVPAERGAAAAAAPVNSLTGEFTAGPNPAVRMSGGIVFFWHGEVLSAGSLAVYDAAGNVVGMVGIKDNAVVGNTGKRAVGSWDLRDKKGRLVSGGTYLVKGKVATSPDGKIERVWLVVGVR
jgi:hypothetical protein